MKPCRCGDAARAAFAALNVNPDATPTPALDDGPEVIGTCEHGVIWTAQAPTHPERSTR